MLGQQERRLELAGVRECRQAPGARRAPLRMMGPVLAMAAGAQVQGREMGLELAPERGRRRCWMKAQAQEC